MITIKSPREIEVMRGAGRAVWEAHQHVASLVQPGVTTEYLDRQVEEFIRDHGGIPTFKGYHGFPASICASINEEVVHGIPGNRELKEGDIVSVDIGVTKDGYVGDSANTYAAGAEHPEDRRLMDVCQGSLAAAISVIRAGIKLMAVSAAVQNHVESHGFSVVRKYVGHGIGRQMHEDPQVPNYVSKTFREMDLVLKPGMVLAVEPMVNAGTHEVKVMPDRWTVVTKDGKKSAHFEHTIHVAEGRADVLSIG